MKILGKFGLFIIGLAAVAGVGAILLPALTKNRHSELAMAIDNVNPLVKNETVYASTSAKPVRQFIGGGGEKEYTYQLVTYNQQGKSRTLTFDSQWRLKPQRFLKIETKGQNVESWSEAKKESVPSGVRQNLMMS
ncbi:YxeA family protein [Levilactobacillus tongjiangensis]|uniref:YxeA family protein n=1 Tax=Levilactobacillus tongjiangensis TaxID=2486023 RepID=A0ABW1SUB4_9LACO|nr:YxeA family protein [Levilactobacillus tongjiangensis]